ncbi:hypothetical protein [Wolbachia endosymbiont of Trichogramma pretiosum]|uniref:hypothetical protein n=1 Tax=Wolbachia endosymbiont of Trichogramma pretiosum TaxID=125593 RepID=UPI000AB7C4CB|nr:hypothetical protein [Wolbachia endosymbiont of Trichogramma pretiosum]OCA06267.1 hypothetical protein wTpre_592 [Wolbachia endosymbiont of Trichogramma pretiosum]
MFPEVGVEGRKIPRTNTRVKYFTPDDQAEYTRIPYEGKLYVDLMLEVESNKLKGFKGKLYDTTDKISKGKRGCVAYVITLDGKLVTHEHININKSEWAYRHSTLACGRPVLCSGLMKVVNVKITYIDNNSGHYKTESENLYNAVKKLEGLFSKDAKVVCLPCWVILKKQIPLIRKIVLAKREPVEESLKRMEKKGKDGLTQYERHFKKMKEFNEKYEQKLLLLNYKSPTNELSYKPTIHKKHRLKYSEYINLHLSFLKEFDKNPEVQKIAIEPSIRRVIGTNYGHKPTVAFAKVKLIDKDGKLQETDEIVGTNVAFHHENDLDVFAKLLDFKKYSYICDSPNEDRDAVEKLMPNKWVAFMSTDQANKFVKDTLQIKIDSVEQLATR